MELLQKHSHVDPMEAFVLQQHEQKVLQHLHVCLLVQRISFDPFDSVTPKKILAEEKQRYFT